jgi:hypothetical protein
VLDKVYEPTGYGAGTHQETSDSGDFTLSYTISVTAPPTSPAPPKGQTAIDPNVLEQLQKGQTLRTPDESLGNQSGIQKKFDDTSNSITNGPTNSKQ